ncbi:hypothetical protein B0T16DRAFT_392255 [Cercophora newfieldiana]|uniref:LysM domain-containing protein n=1 Tax=Cercophora newfieldiana TaxID=92897 RepID=A0AA39Y0L5_9PEZI|nr:hypothetical protein B0T16DRAFT_392255 [Cercophora newfieldiana]
MFPRPEYLTLNLAALGLQVASARSVQRAQQNIIPKFSYAPDTIKSCAWWLDNDGTWTCPKIEETFELSMTDFQRWNPSVSLPCDALPKDQSFCIAASDGRITVEVPVTVGPTVTVTGGPTVTVSRATTETVSTSMTVTVSSQTTLTVSAISTVVVSGITVPVTIPVSVPIPLVSTATVTTTITAPGRGRNGLSTPLPYQPGMVENCKSFYYVEQGETCNEIAARFHIEEGQIVAWNPSAKTDCTNLTAENYACVGIL